MSPRRCSYGWICAGVLTAQGLGNAGTLGLLQVKVSLEIQSPVLPAILPNPGGNHDILRESEDLTFRGGLELLLEVLAGVSRGDYSTGVLAGQSQEALVLGFTQSMLGCAKLGHKLKGSKGSGEVSGVGTVCAVVSADS